MIIYVVRDYKTAVTIIQFFFTKINAFTEKKKYSRLRVLAIFKKQPAEWASPDMELVNSSEPRELLAI